MADWVEDKTPPPLHDQICALLQVQNENINFEAKGCGWLWICKEISSKGI